MPKLTRLTAMKPVSKELLALISLPADRKLILMTNGYQPGPPPPQVRLALMMNRLKIEACIQAALYHALILPSNRNPRSQSNKPDEVSVLLHFFALLPDLEQRLNDLLNKDGVDVHIKGVFCHKSGCLGPVVDFDVPPLGRGCELADLLMLVTHDGVDAGGDFGNGCFLQAKVERGKIRQGPSSKRQSALYCQAKFFRFRNPAAYSTPELPDHPTPGYREMPGALRSGFAFWSYDAFRQEAFEDAVGMRSSTKRRIFPCCGPIWWHASSFMLPPSVNDPTADIGFGNAVYRMMEGSLGIAVGQPQPGDFGWNRIVHDVVLRAIREPLGGTRGIGGLDDLLRACAELDQLVNSGIALVKNPFRNLAKAFGTEALKEAAVRHAEKENRIIFERLRNRDSNKGSDGPPFGNTVDLGPEDSGSSGSFINIQLSSR